MADEQHAHISAALRKRYRALIDANSTHLVIAQVMLGGNRQRSQGWFVLDGRLHPGRG